MLRGETIPVVTHNRRDLKIGHNRFSKCATHSSFETVLKLQKSSSLGCPDHACSFDKFSSIPGRKFCQEELFFEELQQSVNNTY